MQTDSLLPLALFALVTSISPGPSNLMLLASGATYGVRRTVPLLAGITTGFLSVLIAVGLGIGALLAAVPALRLVLNAAGAVYLVYLAWRIGTARSVGAAPAGSERPIGFLEAAGFQWLNPKAWAVAGTTMALHARPESPLASVAAVALVFGLVNLPALATWILSGMALRRLLADPVRLKWFNIAMAVVLVATLVPLLG
ncbi:LysE family translocator [Prosthecomicrobium sp. N25]|uniref:LysE family translocator n=1 Tax=Prosthecomicrobium sp. N25 TaxID=3129254 RepID=UPI0030787B09